MKTNQNSSPPEISRRSFLGKAVKGATLTALFAGLPLRFIELMPLSRTDVLTEANFCRSAK